MAKLWNSRSLPFQIILIHLKFRLSLLIQVQNINNLYLSHNLPVEKRHSFGFCAYSTVLYEKTYTKQFSVFF